MYGIPTILSYAWESQKETKERKGRRGEKNI